MATTAEAATGFHEDTGLSCQKKWQEAFCAT